MGTLATSDVALHQGLHYLRRQKRAPEKEIQYYLEIACDPSCAVPEIFAKRGVQL